MLFMALNMTTFFAGACLSGSQYVPAAYKYYFRPIRDESFLLKHYRGDIQRYRDFDNSIRSSPS